MMFSKEDKLFKLIKKAKQEGVRYLKYSDKDYSCEFELENIAFIKKNDTIENERNKDEDLMNLENPVEYIKRLENGEFDT